MGSACKPAAETRGRGRLSAGQAGMTLVRMPSPARVRSSRRLSRARAGHARMRPDGRRSGSARSTSMVSAWGEPRRANSIASPMLVSFSARGFWRGIARILIQAPSRIDGPSFTRDFVAKSAGNRGLSAQPRGKATSGFEPLYTALRAVAKRRCLGKWRRHSGAPISRCVA